MAVGDASERPDPPSTWAAAHYAAWSSTASLALVTSYKVSQRYHDDEHLLSEPHRSQTYASTRPD
jgi:hypothetical protein